MSKFSLKSKIKNNYGLIRLVFCISVFVVGLCLVTSIPELLELRAYEFEVHNSLFNHANWKGFHAWHIAPMEGRTVQLFNGSQYVVISDYWNSCGCNPDQKHEVCIGFVDKEKYLERVKLDECWETRNYTATRELVIWIDSSLVKEVLK